MRELLPGIALSIFLSIWPASASAQLGAPPPFGAPAPAKLPAPAPVDPARAKWQVCTSVQMVALPEEKALDLLPDLHSDEDQKVEAAVAKIRAMIASKEAIVLAWAIIAGRDGERQVSSAVAQEPYPCDFTSPFLPPPSPEGQAPKQQRVPLVPQAAQSRNAGTTLEVAPMVLQNGKLINLNVYSARVALQAWDTFETGKTKEGIIAEVKYPQFAQESASASVIIKNGHSLLLSVHKLEQPAGYLELVILRASATRLE